MPSIRVVPTQDNSRKGYEAVQRAFGPGWTGPLQIVVPSADAAHAAAAARRDPGIAHVSPPQLGARGMALVQAIPATDPSARATGAAIDRLRAALPAGALVGGPVAESRDLQAALRASTPLVIGVVLGLSFLLLMVALRAPVIAALAVVTNLLAVAAAFGVAKWIFQDGIGHSLLGFEPQGFLDAWAPVFFFAMIFAISMDYTVFLLSSAKEHWDRTGGDAKAAMVGSMASTGRVIFAAGAVMVAVFTTFALSGPLPPKEMGVVLGVAVLLDTVLVRLLILPVLLRLLGKWLAWYLPKPLGRMLPHVRLATPRRADTRHVHPYQAVTPSAPGDPGRLPAFGASLAACPNRVSSLSELPRVCHVDGGHGRVGRRGVRSFFGRRRRFIVGAEVVSCIEQRRLMAPWREQLEADW